MNPYEVEARKMFCAAFIDPSPDEVRVLTADLKGLAKDELDAFDPTNCVPHEDSAYDAATILKQRIGGLVNLRGYVNCLMVRAT